MGQADNSALIHGTGHVLRDLGSSGADREQLRALLAARIIAVLDERTDPVHLPARAELVANAFDDVGTAHVGEDAIFVMSKPQ